MKMWPKCTMILMVAIIAVLLARDAVSQKPPEPRLNHQHGVATINVNNVFNQYGRFKAAMTRMKDEVVETEKNLRNERTGIEAMEKELKEFVVGSDAYNKLDDELLELKSKFNTRAAKQRKLFLVREAEIYYRAYTEFGKAVEQYAQSNNISMVVKISDKLDNPRDREAILKAINQPVVYHAEIDITDAILSDLNERTMTDPF